MASKGNNRLNRKEAFQVADWLKENIEYLNKNRMGARESAQRCSATLGFPVGESSIRTILEDLGLKLKARRPRGNRRYRRTEALANLLWKAHLQIEEQLEFALFSDEDLEILEVLADRARPLPESLHE